MSAVRVLLVGAHGHGRFHLANIRRLSADPGVRLVGVCDTRPLTDELRALTGPVPSAPDMDDLLATTAPDVTIICTPIHTHVDLALAAMRAGSHVLLEKPPAPGVSEYERLRAGIAGTGVACQIGFQSLGSEAVRAARRFVEEGVIGQVRGIGAAGAWIRDASYYARGAWAGRRHLDGLPVMDGALTNPFAHAVATALRVDGSERHGEVTSVETDLYHAHPIEADDTSCLRLTTARGTTITVAVTLCAEHDHEPYVRVHGSRGSITLWYKRDEVRVESDRGVQTATYPCTDLLENLAAHINDRSVPLLVPPERAGAFMDVVEAIRTGPEPETIPDHHQRLEGSGEQLRRVVVGIDEAVETAAEQSLLYRELGLPWAGEGGAGRPPAVPSRQHSDGHEVDAP